MSPIHIALFYLLWTTVTLYFMVVLITYLKNKKDIYKKPAPLKELPFVSIVVPAYNEEKTIKDSLDSLFKIDYPKGLYEVLVVNDGSKDATSEVVAAYENPNLVFVDNKTNRGKAGALNQGIEKARGEIVACMDADTVIEPDAIKKALPYFEKDSIGAVIVRVNAREAKNWMQKIIAMEYNMGLGFYLKIYSLLNCLYLTPGQFSIYRKKMLQELGGFDTKSIVEDTELAYRIQKKGYQIACCLEANAYTNVPSDIRSLYFQRKRWYTGAINTMLKHKDVFFNPAVGNFGVFFMPINYGATLLGVAVLLATVYSTAVTLYAGMTNLSLIDFDIYSAATTFLLNADLDPLSFNIFALLCITPVLINITVNYVGLKTLGEGIKENLFGFICFLFFFLPYHIFWTLCVYFVATKNKVKWRESM